MIFKKIALLLSIIFLICLSQLSCGKKNENIRKELRPEMGDISISISTTGIILPKNRLELKPPISGRVESLRVKEGDQVRAGQVIGWMSSAERAALIDSAIAEGNQSLAYWKNAYKPIPLVSPISGTVIVRAVEPGQSITEALPVIVISDRLIVKADVDETDIGMVRKGQNARIELDAYPDVRVSGKVEHISYESRTVNNVTIYVVDIEPDTIPPVFRSGMSASIAIYKERKKNILLIPREAIVRQGLEASVLVKNDGTPGLLNKIIETGICDETRCEVTSGLGTGDLVIVDEKPFVKNKEKSKNPLFPFRRKKPDK
jgi:macrolide-specific efflux system membrane fusion protein